MSISQITSEIFCYCSFFFFWQCISSSENRISADVGFQPCYHVCLEKKYTVYINKDFQLKEDQQDLMYDVSVPYSVPSSYVNKASANLVCTSG